MTQELWSAVEQYFNHLLIAPDVVLEEVLRVSTAAGLPSIHVTPNQGKFLHLLARIQGARNILEIGTLGGYSTIWLARALPPGGRLITLESEAAHAEVARANIARANLSGVVTLRLGRALDTLLMLNAEGEKPFDFVFIDADKVSTPEYFGWALKLTRRGSLIVVDRKKNMIISGGVNIYPAQVERLLSTLPGVKEVAVLGMPSETWG